MWDALRLDVRHSFRSLRRAPTFSVIVIVTLTVAVGATTAVGSLLNALVLRTVAVPSPEQLVALSALDPRANVSGYFYAETFKAYRSAQRSFAQMSMYAGGGLARVETRSGVFDAVTEIVSPTYFEMVGARASAGRFFAGAPGQRGSDRYVLRWDSVQRLDQRCAEHGPAWIPRQRVDRRSRLLALRRLSG